MKETHQGGNDGMGNIQYAHVQGINGGIAPASHCAERLQFLSILGLARELVL